jgi:hypothetical protein
MHKILDMRKLSAKWIPKFLNDDQKRDGVLASQAILDRFRSDPVGFLNHLVIVDDPETKEQSKEWRHSGSACIKKFKTQKSSGKLLKSVFWDKDGILFVELKQKMVSKRREDKLSKESCFFKTMLLLTRRPLSTRNWQIITLRF